MDHLDRLEAKSIHIMRRHTVALKTYVCCGR